VQLIGGASRFRRDLMEFHVHCRVILGCSGGDQRPSVFFGNLENGDGNFF
jgi:hypothetical protein